MPYDPSRIEPKWQQRWLDEQTFRVEVDPKKPKYYVLDMFPYPSGAGLHVGHPKGYAATDVVARFKRMQGFNVLHPMGWDAFGLPAERAAVRENLHPAVITKRNVDNFRRQIQRLGFSYDWSREIDTSAPDYYRWTQWIFLQLFEKGLAYQAEVAVNWCPALGTVLANEEVQDGKYVETGDPVVKRSMRQWMMKITAYAERLLADLDDLDWPESLKEMQRNWIGKSEGAEVTFQVLAPPGGVMGKGADTGASEFTVFTTRPDTLFGATYCVLAPEHPLVAKITAKEREREVLAYVEKSKQKAERERIAETKEKSGAFTGAHAINPATGKPVPVWVADYVLMGYGTGAIMAVPGHDERDHEFAGAFELPIVEVVRKPAADLSPGAFTGDGVSVNSGFLDGLETPHAKAKMIDWLEQKKLGRRRVQYKLRDWLFSRQRYWGEPFPILHLEDGSTVPMGEDELPLLLPQIDEYKPTSEGEPPLARAKEWLKARDRKSGRPALRETNTMPQWAGSCWYYLRFIDPGNAKQPWSRDAEKYWMPVDLYVGGVEHAVLHLLYARFWHKVLFDLGLVSTKEPFQKLRNQGMILANSFQSADGKYHLPEEIEERGGKPVVKSTGEPVAVQVEKMSKSKYNVVNPDDVIRDHGADAMRLYECFIGPLEAGGLWQTNGVAGVQRFLERTWRLFFTAPKGAGFGTPKGSDVDVLHPWLAAGAAALPADPELERALHKTIKKVGDDLEQLGFNTAISAMMEFVNLATAREKVARPLIGSFLLLVAPFAPHLAEEIWAALGHAESIAHAPWPKFDPALVRDATIEIAVQVNGKLRDTISIPADADPAATQKLALASEKVQKALEGRTPRKVIVVPRKIVNVVA